MAKVFIVCTKGNKFLSQGLKLPTFEMKEVADTIIRNRAYDDHMGMYAPTVVEGKVTFNVPSLPAKAILVSIETGYFFKHNTRVWGPRGKELARGVVYDKKQSHETLLAWLMPGDEIRYTICGAVGGSKTFVKGRWHYNGQYLFHEVTESKGETGSWSERYLVHGKIGIRAVIPVNATEAEQLAAWEKSCANAKMAADGFGETSDRRKHQFQDIGVKPEGLDWYLNFSLEPAIESHKKKQAQEWADLRAHIQKLGLDTEIIADNYQRYIPLVKLAEQILDLNQKIEEVRA